MKAVNTAGECCLLTAAGWRQAAMATMTRKAETSGIADDCDRPRLFRRAYVGIERRGAARRVIDSDEEVMTPALHNLPPY